MTRVLIATDQPILAKGLESVLVAGGIEVVAICHDTFELFESIQSCRPEIAVLDPTVLPAPEIIQDLRRLAPKCQLVGWPQLTTSDSPARLVEAIHMMASFSEPDPSPSTLVNSKCSEAERKLLTLVGFGLNDQEIAAALGWDQATVQKSLRSISDRLGAGDRCELALFGLSTLNEADRYEGRL